MDKKADVSRETANSKKAGVSTGISTNVKKKKKNVPSDGENRDNFESHDSGDPDASSSDDEYHSNSDDSPEEKPARVGHSTDPWDVIDKLTKQVQRLMDYQQRPDAMNLDIFNEQISRFCPSLVVTEDQVPPQCTLSFTDLSQKLKAEIVITNNLSIRLEQIMTLQNKFVLHRLHFLEWNVMAMHFISPDVLENELRVRLSKGQRHPSWSTILQRLLSSLDLVNLAVEKMKDLIVYQPTPGMTVRQALLALFTLHHQAHGFSTWGVTLGLVVDLVRSQLPMLKTWNLIRCSSPQQVLNELAAYPIDSIKIKSHSAWDGSTVQLLQWEGEQEASATINAMHGPSTLPKGVNRYYCTSCTCTSCQLSPEDQVGKETLCTSQCVDHERGIHA